MHEPDHEEDEVIEDQEVDEQMDPGVRTKPQRYEDDTGEETPHDEEPDVPDGEMTWSAKFKTAVKEFLVHTSFKPCNRHCSENMQKRKP